MVDYSALKGHRFVEGSAYEQAYAAAESRGFGTSRSDVQYYAETGGYAYGSYLCGPPCGELMQWSVAQYFSAFSDAEEEANREYTRIALLDLAAQWEITLRLGEAWVEAVSATLLLYGLTETDLHRPLGRKELGGGWTVDETVWTRLCDWQWGEVPSPCGKTFSQWVDAVGTYVVGRSSPNMVPGEAARKRDAGLMRLEDAESRFRAGLAVSAIEHVAERAQSGPATVEDRGAILITVGIGAAAIGGLWWMTR